MKKIRKILRILRGESELTNPTKYGFLACEVQFDNGEKVEAAIYPEQYRLEMKIADLTGKTVTESDLLELVELTVKAEQRDQRYHVASLFD